ncbi:MAG: serine/threonine-protein kinase PknK [Sandaracinaceae bacterium]
MRISERFTVLEAVGAGGMGTVYRGTDAHDGATVAIKVVHGVSDVDYQRFVREATLMSRVSHPALVRYVDHGVTDDGRGYLAMEWLEGEDLAKRLGKERLEPSEVIALARRVASGLEALHAAGAVHRDLKPSNLFLPNGEVHLAKILDIGIARLSHTQFGLTAMTAPGALVGTPSYIAPEQARGHGVDARTDLYSFGIVLWECLAHERAFTGPDLMAVLASVLFDPLPSIAERAGPLPEALAALVDGLTQKAIEARVASAAEVVRALDAIVAPVGERRMTQGRLSVLTPLEMRVVTMVVAGPGADLEGEDGSTMHLDRSADEARALARLGARCGARTELLPDGTALAVIDGGEATDGAVRAARFARGVLDVRPGASVVIATGRAIADRLMVGEAMERAGALLGRVRTDAILVDEVSASLLRTRYALIELDGGHALGDELPAKERTAEVALPLFGRDRELALLGATIEESAAEPCARAVVIQAAAGLGKTRLLDAVARGVAPSALTIRASGDPMRQRSSYSLLAPGLRVAFAVETARSLDDARARLYTALAPRFGEDAVRVASLIGELVGVPFADDADPGLAALRAEPRAHVDLVRAAFIEVVQMWSERAPVVFLLDDLQWADRPSVALLDACLRTLDARPISIIAVARPELAERFDRLFDGRDLARMTLAPLTKRATLALARRIAPDLADDVLARVVERAEGNPFFAEELARAASEDDHLPASVLASIQRRLDALDPEARRILRAASVLGLRFHQAALDALIQDPHQPIDVAGWLDGLVRSGWLERVAERGLETEPAYSFRHGLVKDACYAMLTPDDRRRAHRNAARWFETNGGADAAALAEHFERAGLGQHALQHRLAAAQRALRAGDPESVVSHARAVQGGSDPELAALARLMEAEARLLEGRAEEAAPLSREAIAGLPVSRREHLDALCVWIEAASTVGWDAGLEEPIEAALEHAREAEASLPFALALARMSTPLLLLDRSDLAARCADAAHGLALRLAGTLGTEDGLLSGRLAENRAFAALAKRDVVSAVEAFENAEAAYARGGAERFTLASACNAASKRLELGQAERAIAISSRVIERADRRGFSYYAAFARLVVALARYATRELDAALELATDAAQRFASLRDARLESASRSAIAEVSALRGELDTALREASRAVGLVDELVAPKAAALSVLAAVELARGDLDAARTLVEEAKVLAAVEPMLDRDVHLEWTHARILRASGRNDEARRIARAALDTVEANAIRIEDDELRRTFLEQVEENRALRSIV